MFWLMGGWDNRRDSLREIVNRLQDSMWKLPAEPESYGPWGFWRTREGMEREFVTIDIDSHDALTELITAQTQEVHSGPGSTPGAFIELARASKHIDSTWCEYLVRAGFIDRPRPYNHIGLQVDENIDERTLMRYMSALVVAWQPDRLGGVTFDTKDAQGHQGPQVAVGRLTYIRAGFPFNTDVLGDGIDITDADSGRYIRVPGTLKSPSLDHILRVRDALGYPRAG